ncbi:thioredoxin family protein [Collinsella provencensis]|uniref:thioredoxin family protein n=1 Tax=Collinsella provencensis TaxID=1937461 RepID=UPI000C84DE5B|nr:thioredoxin family protein [Collinsella provencensis]
MGLFGFGKKKEEKAAAPCACGEDAPQMKAEPCGCGGARQLKVLGAGCKKCHELNENTQAAIAELGLEAELEYITDMDRVMGYGAMSLPALVVDGKVVSAGMVLTPAEVAAYLR